jgi:hypothetical protein
VARKAIIIGEFMRSLSGKQSDKKPDTSRLSNAPSEVTYLGSKQLFPASSDVRFGSEAALAPGPLPARSGHRARQITR